MDSLRGQFLLATPDLRDSTFARAVILMLRHDDEGALGVIINAPLNATVKDALGDELEVAVDEPLRRGGPCEGPMIVLHDRNALDASDEILPGIFFTHSRNDIERVMADESSNALYVVGYSGWQADQLEREMEEGSWLTLPANPNDVFDNTADLWQRLSAKARLLKFLPPEQIPDDPNLN